MIEKNRQNEIRGRMLLEQMSERQIEILHEYDHIECNGRAYNIDDLEAHELALIADIADLFETNYNDHLLDPRYGMPVNDLREIAEHDNPPEDAGLVTDERLESLV